MDDLPAGTPSTPSAETPAAGAPATDQPELELEIEGAEDGQPGDGEDELEDWEDEGKTYKVPKALKPRLMKDADYTRKTMEVAETRKAVEAQKAEVEETAKFHRENVREVAKLIHIDEQLEAFRALTREQWNALKPEDAMRLQTEMNLLKDQRERAVGELQQKQQQALEKQRDTTAKQYQDSLARIAKEIPGWSDELAGKLNGYATSKGFTLDELQMLVLKPHAVGTLHKAFLYDQLVAKQRAKAAKPVEEPAPVPVQTVGQRRTPTVKDPNRMNPEEYRRWRMNGGGNSLAR
jgi:hypothetical protein